MSDVTISFEFFPPRTLAAEGQFWSTLAKLERHEPDFASVTYGAGGSSHAETLEVLERVARKTSIPMVGHLTCVGQSREETDRVIHAYKDAGVRGIVALRGDMPEPGMAYEAHPEGYKDTPELVAAIKEIGDFDVSVSAYPEPHPDSPDTGHDIELLKRKVEAGADRALTQFCFVNESIVSLRDAAATAQIDVPIVPGVLPVTNFKGTARMAQRCGASVPQWLADRYEGVEDDPQVSRMLAAVIASEQVNYLHREGFEQFHLYTLNRPEIATTICQLLGVTPVAEIAA
jgi:methylenetetrahydrofolate reductase (NADPH)